MNKKPPPALEPEGVIKVHLRCSRYFLTGARFRVRTSTPRVAKAGSSNKRILLGVRAPRWTLQPNAVVPSANWPGVASELTSSVPP